MATITPEMDSFSLERVLQALEREREARWQRGPEALRLKLHWRAQATKRCLHVLPNETILELGGGSGLLTEQLGHVFRGENPITSLVFSEEFLDKSLARNIPCAILLYARNLSTDLGLAQFDYVIGSGMLWHRRLPECLALIYRVLKPGGRILFFEPNFLFPVRVFHQMTSSRGRMNTLSVRVDRVIQAVSHQEFTHIDIAPHDMVSCRLGPRIMRRLQAKAVLLEHMPGARLFCASMCVSARKPGARSRPVTSLATRSELHNTVSVVLPAHNEAPNLAALIEQLISLYGSYIHEIIVVNDNSKDATEAVVQTIAMAEPRVHLLNRTPPSGVGRALKDGYRAATGQYILSMDCDFVDILPELRELFEVVADGHEGAIGSRFSHESILTDYPFWKLFFNRLCHLLIKVFLLDRVRDISNNLKLYRAEILKNLEIQSPHFAANLETGLGPLLAGRDIVEVPISWSNRTFAMGESRFDVRKVGVDYVQAFFRCCWRKWEIDRRGLFQRMLRRRHPSVRQ